MTVVLISLGKSLVAAAVMAWLAWGADHVIDILVVVGRAVVIVAFLAWMIRGMDK